MGIQPEGSTCQLQIKIIRVHEIFRILPWMANDWFITHQSLHKNKGEKKHQGGEGNGLNPVSIVMGNRWF